jgi:primosomal protein N''
MSDTELRGRLRVFVAKLRQQAAERYNKATADARPNRTVFSAQGSILETVASDLMRILETSDDAE